MVYDLWDCVATIPPYPHYIGERGDGYNVASAISDPDSIFFRCTLRRLRPINATKGRYNRYSEDIGLDLFFSTAQARDHAGAAMCMISTPGCGTLAGPSLVLVDFQSPKPKR